MPRPRCERCARPLEHCLCALIPSLHSRTQVLILQHPSEVRHALNTASLLALGLQNAELWVGEQFEQLAAYLAQPGYRSYLLFPGEAAQPLTAVRQEADQMPVRLVVPDGTWRKARKLLYLNPLLANLPRVTLPPGQQSRYRLRKAPMEGSLSTIEAVTAALQLLEPEQSFAALLQPFDALIEGQIRAMGAHTFARNHSNKT
ncbi:tRNA-uridine aminocarboxypropyltransferase [Pseudomonas segetis]|uniref:tRNA-uridine aminocarboxypropyltransferase n=1 Tax=Pseudomonas segetis TaxID=298908 RepID=A0A239A2Q7_9PSED|nr:DTW domain-containing protein [Pseudomonas segetis]SNR89591.1 DTW domain-containing protein YfiP [Pseudomonas segetis]